MDNLQGQRHEVFGLVIFVFYVFYVPYVVSVLAVSPSPSGEGRVRMHWAVYPPKSSLKGGLKYKRSMRDDKGLSFYVFLCSLCG